jgi:hypothetical protein
MQTVPTPSESSLEKRIRQALEDKYGHASPEDIEHIYQAVHTWIVDKFTAEMITPVNEMDPRYAHALVSIYERFKYGMREPLLKKPLKSTES